MKVFAGVFMYFFCFSFAFASEKFSLTVDRMPLQQLIMLHYDNCEKRGIVFDASAQKFDDQITMKTGEIGCADSRSLIAEVLSRSSLTLMRRSAFDFLTKSKEVDEAADWTDFVYRPAYRDPIELADTASVFIKKGSFAHQRRAAVLQSSTSAAVVDNGSNGASLSNKAVDKLVFVGPPAEIKMLSALFKRIDVPPSQIQLQVSVLEFQNGSSRGDAVSAALRLFGSKVSASVSSPAQTGAVSLKINLPSFSAALDLLDKDSRFKYLSRPTVLVQDGQEVNFVAGQDVRVRGDVVVNGSGQAIQSVATVSAGIALNATPRIRGEAVDLSIRQTVSDFANSPNSEVSIVRRELSSRILMQAGAVYLIGGLQSSRQSFSKSSFLGFETSASSEANATEVLLLLSFTRDDSFDDISVAKN